MTVFFVLIILLIGLIPIYYINRFRKKTSIHQFKGKQIDGSILNFASLKGKKLLIVNTASKCRFTTQFKELEELYRTYKDGNFTIIGFPCNQFNEQDSGSNDEIQEFCTKNYGVTFIMMEKVDVKGDNVCEIYDWLTSKQKNGVMSSSVIWNFQKYLIDENGFLVTYVLPIKKPNCRKIVNWITK